MRWGTVTLCALAFVAACGGSTEPMAVDFVRALDDDSDALAVTGAAVDDDMMCAEGSLVFLGIEDMDGVAIPQDQMGSRWEQAAETGETLETMFYDRFTCADGSGSFVLETHNVVTPAELDFEGTNDVGSWEIADGTGAYESLTGRGDYIGDFAAGEERWTGEVQEG